VEFEYYGITAQGLVFSYKEMSKGFAIVSKFDGATWEYNPVRESTHENIRKVGYTGSIPHKPISIEEAHAIAKAYFSAKPKFKVGDRVVDSLALATYTPDHALSYGENQAAAVKFYGWEKGSKVKVVRTHKQDEDGFCKIVNKGKDEAVGSTFNIIAIYRDGIKLNHILFSQWFPYFALEPVS
jgi:hypothetical protein